MRGNARLDIVLRLWEYGFLKAVLKNIEINKTDYPLSRVCVVCHLGIIVSNIIER